IHFYRTLYYQLTEGSMNSEPTYLLIKITSLKDRCLV
ncbi:unnamed protein product, partial [Heterotrigona itama]